MATDRQGTIYEGAAGVRTLGQDAPMTTDSVFAIFSTTKAITGTACLQLVEEGRLDLDAPAERYAPDIGKLQVLEGFADDGNAQAAAAQARRHHPHAAAAHGRVRLRLLQRELQSPGHGAGATQRDHGVEGGIAQPAPVRPGRRLGIWQQPRLGRPGRRGHHGQAAGSSDAGAHLRPARHDQHRLHVDPQHACAPRVACTSGRPMAR